MGRRWTARRANGVVSALIVVFFLAHGTLGAFSLLTGFIGPLAWLVWCGVALLGVHVVVSVVTSSQQLSDAEHPPSARKKRHLLLKWVTGALLGVVAAAHTVLPLSSVSAALVIIALSLTLAVHLCVGSKSLLKDLGISRRYKGAFRVVVCSFAAAFVLVVLFGLVAR